MTSRIVGCGFRNDENGECRIRTGESNDIYSEIRIWNFKFDRNVRRDARFVGGAEGHPALGGKTKLPCRKAFGKLRAVSPVERPRPVAGELRKGL